LLAAGHGLRLARAAEAGSGVAAKHRALRCPLCLPNPILPAPAGGL